MKSKLNFGKFKFLLKKILLSFRGSTVESIKNIQYCNWIPRSSRGMTTEKTDKWIFCLSWLFILVLGRLVPHLPNMTPTLSLCVFGMWWLRRKFFFLFAIIAIEISDFLLAKYYGFSSFGYWSIFNDSAYLMIMLLTLIFRSHFSKFFSLQIFSLISCLFFWLWTNFGVWLFSDMYSHTLVGFSACYILALPFLKNALIADLIWITVLWLCVYLSGLKQMNCSKHSVL